MTKVRVAELGLQFLAAKDDCHARGLDWREAKEALRRCEAAVVPRCVLAASALRQPACRPISCRSITDKIKALNATGPEARILRYRAIPFDRAPTLDVIAGLYAGEGCVTRRHGMKELQWGATPSPLCSSSPAVSQRLVLCDRGQAQRSLLPSGLHQAEPGQPWPGQLPRQLRGLWHQGCAALGAHGLVPAASPDACQPGSRLQLSGITPTSPARPPCLDATTQAATPQLRHRACLAATSPRSSFRRPRTWTSCMRCWLGTRSGWPAAAWCLPPASRAALGRCSK